MCYEKSGLLYPAGKLGELTKHHRKPRSIGGKSDSLNVSRVPEKLHNAWHLLFANNHVIRIVAILNEHWTDPDYTIIAVPNEDLEKVQQALVKGNKY
jgi:hypothetical protein